MAPKGSKFMASVGAGATRVRQTFKTEPEALAWEAEENARRAALVTAAVAQATAAAAPPEGPSRRPTTRAHRHVWRNTPGERKAMLNAKQALAFLGPDTPTSAITGSWIVEWMEAPGREREQGATCNRKMSALSVMLKRAEEFGGLIERPRMNQYKESKQPDDCHKGMLLAHAGTTKNGSARSVTCTSRVRAIVELRSRVFEGLTNSSLRKQWDNLRAMLKKHGRGVHRSRPAAYVLHPPVLRGRDPATIAT